MGLLDLPIEIFRIILVEAIRVRGLKRALRLRLVSSMCTENSNILNSFSELMNSGLLSEELVEALCVTRLIGSDHQETTTRMWPWARPYFETRLRERRTLTLPRLRTIETIADTLAAEEGLGTEYETYALQLLHLASSTGERIAELFHHTLPQEKDEFLQNLFVAAISTSRVSFVACLMDSQAERMANTPFGNAFVAAVEADNEDVRTMMFAVQSCQSFFLRTALLRGDPQLVKDVLAMECALDNSWYDSRAKEHGSMSRGALAAFLKTPSVEIFELMLSELKSRQPVELNKALLSDLIFRAARSGWTDMMKHLISLGAPIGNLNRPSGTYPLWHACKYGHDEIAQMLLDAGERPRNHAYDVAVGRGHNSILKRLLRSQTIIDPSATRNCLYNAARMGYTNTVHLLLDFGSDPNEGDTAPLIGAMEAEHTAIFRLLVQRGAMVSRILPEARERAEKEGLESMLQLLREFEAALPTSAGGISMT
jgi:hypothetical protein